MAGQCHAGLESLGLTWGVETIMGLHRAGRVPSDPKALLDKVGRRGGTSLDARRLSHRSMENELCYFAQFTYPPVLSQFTYPPVLSQVGSVATAAGGAGQLQTAVQRFSSALGLPDGWQVPVEDVMAACVAAPRVLTMPSAAVAQRATEVETMLRVSPRRARELCIRSPALLLVSKIAIEAKLKAMTTATGLDLEACAIMITVHMFPELKRS